MVESAEAIARLQAWVVWSGLAIGLAFGVVSQLSRFCTLGAIADWVSMGSSLRLRMWLLAMAVAILASQGLVILGLLNDTATIYTSSRFLWLSQAVGGGLFGFGMALASGCGAKALVRMGEGSLKALIVFLVMGLSAFMSFRGITALWRVQTLDRVVWQLDGHQDLPRLLEQVLTLAGLPVDGSWLRGLVAAGVSLVLLVLVFRPGRHSGRLGGRLLVGGVSIGLLISLGWLVTGWLGFVAEHPDTLAPAYLATNTRGPESLTFVGPLAYSLEYLIYATDRSQFVSFAIATVVGTVAGAAISALSQGKFRWEGFRSNQDLSDHLIGALLMGIGGATAMGCTIGHGLSGISMLSLGSIWVVVWIFGGTRLGLGFLSARV